MSEQEPTRVTFTINVEGDVDDFVSVEIENVDLGDYSEVNSLLRIIACVRSVVKKDVPENSSEKAGQGG